MTWPNNHHFPSKIPLNPSERAFWAFEKSLDVEKELYEELAKSMESMIICHVHREMKKINCQEGKIDWCEINDKALVEIWKGAVTFLRERECKFSTQLGLKDKFHPD